MFPPTIDDYYRQALDKVKAEVQQRRDADVVGLDPDEWARYLVDRYSMEPIEADIDGMRMEETTLKGYDAVLGLVPIGTGTLDTIAKNGLATGGGVWLGFDYRTFFSDGRPGIIGQVVPPTEGEVNQRTTRGPRRSPQRGTPWTRCSSFTCRTNSEHCLSPCACPSW